MTKDSKGPKGNPHMDGIEPPKPAPTFGEKLAEAHQNANGAKDGAAKSAEAPKADAGAAPKVDPAAGRTWVQWLKKEDGLFGNVSKHNPWDVIKNNFDHKSAGNHWGKVAFRSVGSVAGVGMVADSVFRSKTSDGEDRGTAGRIIEFIVGGGVAAGSLLAGKAR